MAKRIFQQVTWTPTAQVDQAITGAFQALKGGSANDIIKISKVLCMGQAASSAINAMVLARSLVLGITPTTLAVPNSDGPANIFATAPSAAPVAYVAAATGPNRTTTVGLSRLNLSFNAFGGIIQWQTNPGSEEEFVLVGSSTVSQSEASLSAANIPTPGLMGSDIFYEVL